MKAINWWGVLSLAILAASGVTSFFMYRALLRLAVAMYVLMAN